MGKSVKKLSKNIKNSALKELDKVINTSTPGELDKAWGEYKTKYNKYEFWIHYLYSKCITHVEKWWKDNFRASINSIILIRQLKLIHAQGLIGNYTNNCVESWHQTLKYSYLGRAKKYQIDDLALVLLQEGLPDFRRNEVRALLGFDGGTQKKSKSEQNQ